jgi:hypothetical protein
VAIDNSTSSSALSSAAQNVAPSEINILIKSNRNYPQGFNAMGGPYNGNDNANATQEYRYNFTGYTFNTQNSILTIQVKGIGSPTFTTLSTPFAGNTPESVAQTLNTLSIGIFNTYTSFGQTYVSSYNDTNVFGDLTIFSEIVSVEQGITTQGGDPLTAQNGDIITTEVSNTTIFPVEYIPQGDPALSITIQDAGGGGGTGGPTYAQVRNAFSQNNYEVQGMYLYSPDIQQLSNVIQYNYLDASGNKQILNVTNMIDPNQFATSSLVDLSQFDGAVVFNGNSFITSSIAPFGQLQMKFLAKNINTNSDLSSNFLDIENATNTKFFEPPDGSISVFERNEAEILNKVPEEVVNMNIVDRYKASLREGIDTQNEQTTGVSKSDVTYNPINIIDSRYTPLILLSVAGIAAIYLFSKKKNN